MTTETPREGTATDERAPAEVFPLGQYIGDEMEAREWNSMNVALRMGSEEDYSKNALIVEFILAAPDEKLIIDDRTFADLSRAFGVSPQFFKNLHTSWLKWPDRRQKYEAPEILFSGTFKP